MGRRILRSAEANTNAVRNPRWREARRCQGFSLGRFAADVLAFNQIYLYSVYMATSVHLPEELLEELDRRAKEVGMSRNRYIVEALRAAILRETSWSPRLLQMLAEAARDEEASEAVEEMMSAISSGRTRKSPPKL